MGTLPHLPDARQSSPALCAPLQRPDLAHTRPGTGPGRLSPQLSACSGQGLAAPTVEPQHLAEGLGYKSLVKLIPRSSVNRRPLILMLSSLARSQGRGNGGLGGYQGGERDTQETTCVTLAPG